MTKYMNKYVVWFKDVDKEDGPTVGGKGANLGELTRAGLPVPPGFIVTAEGSISSVGVGSVRGISILIVSPWA